RRASPVVPGNYHLPESQSRRTPAAVRSRSPFHPPAAAADAAPCRSAARSQPAPVARSAERKSRPAPIPRAPFAASKPSFLRVELPQMLGGVFRQRPIEIDFLDAIGLARRAH